MAEFSLGIDIGSFHTKVVCLKKEENKTSLASYGLLKTFGNNDKTISFLNKISAHTHDVRVALETSDLKIRRIDIPTTNPEEINEAIKWGCMKIIEGDVDEYEYRFRALEENEAIAEGKTPVVAYAVKKQSLNNIYSLFEKTNLPRPKVIEPTSNALANIFSYTTNNTNREILIEIGYEKTLFAVVSPSGLLFSRPMTSAGEKDLIDQVSRDLHLNFDQAKEIKELFVLGKQTNLPEHKISMLKNTINHFFSRMAIEIQRSIDGYMLTFDRQKIENIYICGGGSFHKNLAGYLGKTLAIQTGLFNPFTKINTNQFPGDHLTQKQALFSVCCGLAVD